MCLPCVMREMLKLKYALDITNAAVYVCMPAASLQEALPCQKDN